MSNIIISEITKYALTEDDGRILRNLIKERLTYNDVVNLDFSDVKVFATPFFNSSIGYFFINLDQDEFERKINLLNLSELGKNTYLHCIENAKIVKSKEKNFDKDAIGKITTESINND